MADAQEHPLLAEGKKVCTRDVLAVGHIGQVVSQKIAPERPSFQILRLQQWRIFAARNGIVGVANEETIWIPMADRCFRAVGIAHVERIRRFPRGQLPVLSDGNLIFSRCLTVIDGSGLAFLGDKTGAAEHAVTRE